MKHALTLAFSPCPNDTFMFHAWVEGLINMQGHQFKIRMADVEELNQSALKEEADITKLSFAAFAHLADKYELLTSGAALGHQCGPLLVSKHNFKWEELPQLKIVIPGKFTTANLLLTMFAPDVKNKKELLFSDIENEVLTEKADAGLVIHESRFTYHLRGLKKIADLGELWEHKYKCPLPLGCIAVKKSLPPEVKMQLNKLMHDSVVYAMKNPKASAHFIGQHAQEMDISVQQQHISLYVNQWSKELGETGKMAIRKLLAEGEIAGLLPKAEAVFVDELKNLVN
ncbi:MAG TPA: 1,4-dihydroxy-6-naphthoate synthase [Bacteroidia bacterium]|jgi:1,4-dihydroxy-6-naphthoate synthase|nr:1,4-dihydroxy-6-naphthoate synthase [Bacteroidia bacterium]